MNFSKVIRACSNVYWLAVPLILCFVSFLEAVEPTLEGKHADPCAPKGYSLDAITQKHLSGFLAEESKLASSFQAVGNYSECRSAALSILQEGNGTTLSLLLEFHDLHSFLLFLMDIDFYL